VAPPPPPWLFYFDFISPYAFLGWRQIRPLAERHGRVLEPVPVLFAALLGAHGTKGPAEVAAKRRYLGQDIARKAHRLGVSDMKPPPAHPFHPLVALRVASAPAHDATPGAKDRIIDELFSAVWTKSLPIDTPDAVASVLTGAGLDGPALVRAAEAPETKERLRAETDAAIRKGIFGVPTVDAGGALYWGTDAIQDLDLVTQGKLPSFSDVDWSSLPVGVRRNT
jgi:2-hydroxychromene-2-carboxylate isomerase